LQLINPSTSPNELNTTLTPHSIIHGDACFAYFNKIWGIPVTVVAIVVGFAAPTWANDRPSDPFGNHTVELNNGTPLFEMWESLRDQVLLDRAH
jgi:hypothetical protein